MLRTLRKPAIIVGITLGVIVVLYAAATTTYACCARYHASLLLDSVRDLHPGVTTEQQARVRLKSLARYEVSYPERRDGMKIEDVDYSFDNMAEWTDWIMRPLPIDWASHISLPWTKFEVTITYQSQIVSKIHIVEMQQDIPGMPHPNSVSTTIFSSYHGQQLGLPAGGSNFAGYSTYSRSTGQVDADGKFTDFSCCHERWITLDERATPAQLTSSLNFQLHCMTSLRRCKDDRAILP